jgi:signal transduction histidine kinase
MKLINQNNSIEKYAQIGRISHELFHDILNPITGLLLYLEIIQKDNQKELINSQIQEIKNSSRNVRDFLKIIQNSFLYPNKKHLLDINKETQNVIRLTSQKAIKNNVSIILISNTKERLFIPKIDFYQLIINLISNSIDSFEKIKDNRKRKVIIKVIENDNFFEFFIIDNGCGISQEDYKNIFKNGFSKKDEGFGIGLRTVKKILKRNSGKIEINKTTINKGTEFKITIPKNH